MAFSEAEASEVSSEFFSRTVSEPMSIYGLLNDWEGKLYPGDLAWSKSRLELSFRARGWRLAYIERYDYLLRFNSATAELQYREENDLPAPESAVPVKLDAWHLRADGVKLGHLWRWENGFYIEPAVTLLRATDFQDGLLQGELSSEGGVLQGKAELDYHYTEDKLLDHQFEHPSGKGVTVDLALGWQSEGREFNLRLEDIAGHVQWEAAPYTRGHLDTVDRGGANEVSLEPAFSGFRGEEDYRQRFPVYGTASFIEERGQVSWQLDAEYYADQFWLRPGLRWEGLPGNPYLGYETRDRQWMLQLSPDNSIWYFQFGSDSADLEKARSLTVAAGLSLVI